MRILVVEDHEDVAVSVKTGLEAACFAVDLAPNGEIGSRLACTNAYDLVILDKVLPLRSGIDVCRDIREAKKTCFILILSVIQDAEEKTLMLNAGADDYLTKPFSFSELLARIHALFRRLPHFTGNMLTVGNLSMDTRRHIVRRNDREFLLTRKEFALLEYFMRNSGTVLTRAAIMEHVWDMHLDSSSNTIEAHILSLRKKLARVGGRDLIVTISGVGYKLVS